MKKLLLSLLLLLGAFSLQAQDPWQDWWLDLPKSFCLEYGNPSDPYCYNSSCFGYAVTKSNKYITVLNAINQTPGQGGFTLFENPAMAPLYAADTLFNLTVDSIIQWQFDSVVTSIKDLREYWIHPEFSSTVFVMNGEYGVLNSVGGSFTFHDDLFNAQDNGVDTICVHGCGTGFVYIRNFPINYLWGN